MINMFWDNCKNLVFWSHKLKKSMQVSTSFHLGENRLETKQPRPAASLAMQMEANKTNLYRPASKFGLLQSRCKSNPFHISSEAISVARPIKNCTEVCLSLAKTLRRSAKKPI